MRIRLIAAAVAGVALSMAAGGNAVVPAKNGSIYFVGARAENFYAEIYSVAADGSGRANVSRSPDADESPAVSPNGEQIAFVSHRDGYEAAYVTSADGRDERKLTDGLSPPRYALTRPVWSPTGRTLLFIEHNLTTGGFCNPSRLHAVEVATRARRRLVESAVHEASFSSDERFIAYQWLSCRESPRGLAVRRLDGSAKRTFGAAGRSPSWSPRGQRLLFLRSSRRARLNNNIVTVDPFGRRRWVLTGVPASAPAWSPSGQSIAFFRRAGARPGLYVVRPGPARPRLLVPVRGGSAVAWSPDGARLAFSAAGGTYVVRSTGKGITRVGDPGSRPQWSGDSRHFAFVVGKRAALVATPAAGSAVPVTSSGFDVEVGQIDWASGNRLVFTSRRPDAAGVFAVEPAGGAVRQVTPDGAPRGRVSPDISRVAFVRNSHIWTARLDGSDERQLTSGAVKDAEPAWSPDGQRIAFARGNNIFVVESGGGHAQQITRLASTDPARGPAWSPDGAWIAFTTRGLFAVRADGTGLHRIVSTDGLAAGLDPAWSPDGTKLALGGSAIAVVNADGTGYQPLTMPRGARHMQPAWSPDGKKIVFARSGEPQFSDDSDLWTLNLDGSGETRVTDGPWPDVLPAWTAMRP